MSDEDLKRMSGHDAVMRLNPTNRERWLDIVGDDAVSDALRVAINAPDRPVERQIREGMARRASKYAEVSADHRHGEEMTAAAVANQIGLKALRRSNLSLIFSVVAIVAAIATAVWQHYSR
jgi:hypothetical protein